MSDAGPSIAFGRRMTFRITLLAPLVFALVACGGSVEGSSIAGGTQPAPSPSQQVQPGGSQGGEPRSGGGNNCTAMPACDGDDQRVANASACLQDDARCYTRSLCGQTIWCTGPVATCLALPSCGPGQEQVDTCPDGGACRQVTVCGQTITCKDSVQCAGYPSCDGNDKEVTEKRCQYDDIVCYERSLCGVTIWCSASP